MLYLLQKVISPLLGEGVLILHELAAHVLEALEREKWLHPDNSLEVLVSSLDGVSDLSSGILLECIPIGSIEFVETVLSQVYGQTHIKPVNIPPGMDFYRFWKRRFAVGCGAASVQQVYEDWGREALFIKSLDRVKSDITGIYHRKDDPSQYDSESKLLISEVLPMAGASEWRLFVLDRRIIATRCYAGNERQLPDLDFIKDVCGSLPANMRACTVDIAVLKNGENVIIEIHDFVSCGLYGAEVPLCMYKLGYEQQKSHTNLF